MANTDGSLLEDADPRFTREDVRAIRNVVEAAEGWNMDWCIDNCSRGDEQVEKDFRLLKSLARRIEALLPPE